jgi:hypothetical protein
MTETRVSAALAAYIRGLADWRRARYNDDLRDARNLRSAAGLDELAAFVLALPADDARLQHLRRLCIRGEVFEPGQQLSYEAGRFRFYAPDATLDGFVDRMVELAEADAGEHGRFGGLQVPGDEPWRP